MKTFYGEFISAETGEETPIAGPAAIIMGHLRAMKDGDTMVINCNEDTPELGTVV